MLYSAKNVTFGKSFTADGLPRILIDTESQIRFGDNVHLRRDVEIRAHKKGSIIIGNDIRLDRSIRLLTSNQASIEIGDKTRIGLNTVLNGGDSIKIGKNVLISGFVYLQTSMHNFSDSKSINEQGYSHQPINIEDDAWIGTHATIMPGITLNRGSIVGSNAVVNRNFNEDNIILGGVPAKPLKKRFT